ncbi:MAG: hypothetical protein R2932_43490 [Caldilineaceae bacterium]
MDDLLATATVVVPASTALSSMAAAMAQSPWQNPLPGIPPALTIAGGVVALLAFLQLWRWRTLRKV